MTSQTPPGWYRDPYGTPGLQRYWDGSQWTQVTQPADEWGAGGGAQESPSGHVPGGAEQSMPGYGQQPANGYGQAPPYGQQAPEYGQAPPYGQQAPEYGQQQSGWAAPGAGPDWGTGAQQGWQQQPPVAGKSNAGLMWALIGGGGVVLVLVIVVALFATGIIGGDQQTAAGSSTSSSSEPPPTSSAPEAGGSGKSPVTGTVTDTQAGLSYAQLGGAWETPETIPPTSDFSKQLGFDRGASAVVQTDYNGPNTSYVASVYSGVLPATVRSGSLEQGAKNLFNAIYPKSYPTPNTRQDLESKAYTVSGKKAWLYKVQMSFPQAETKGWNFTKETAVIVTVQLQSGKAPATFYISIPDSHKTQGDLDLLLGSLKAQ